jgi:hypothetical protein
LKKNSTLWIITVVLPGNNLLTLLEPLINFTLRLIVLIFVSLIYRKENYFLSFNMVNIVPLSIKHISSMSFLNLVNGIIVIWLWQNIYKLKYINNKMKVLNVNYYYNTWKYMI